MGPTALEIEIWVGRGLSRSRSGPVEGSRGERTLTCQSTVSQLPADVQRESLESNRRSIHNAPPPRVSSLQLA